MTIDDAALWVTEAVTYAAVGIMSDRAIKVAIARAIKNDPALYAKSRDHAFSHLAMLWESAENASGHTWDKVYPALG